MIGTKLEHEVTLVREPKTTESTVYTFLRKAGNTLLEDNQIVNQIVIAVSNKIPASASHYEVVATPITSL